MITTRKTSAWHATSGKARQVVKPMLQRTGTSSTGKVREVEEAIRNNVLYLSQAGDLTSLAGPWAMKHGRGLQSMATIARAFAFLTVVWDSGATLLTMS